ncbi:MAG: diguanylate cyclase domain-containing protein, partial [Burkholderiales bacterium]
MLLAFGILLMHAGAGSFARRTLILLTIGFSTMSIADIVWAMAKVTGTYLPGGLSDALYLSCYAWLIAAAREQLRGAPAARQEPSALGSAAVQGMPYVAMLVSFLVLVYVESSSMSSPATAMTVIIFALTLLVMLRQGVMSRDDALLREQRAAGIVEARYASLIKHASDVIMIADVDGRVRFASPAAERTFGMNPDDLAGRNLLDLWAESDRERLAAFLAEVAASDGRSIGPVEVTVGNGARRSTLESVGSNLRDDPAIAGLALNFRDVSERKALEEQLRQLAFHDPLTLLANRSLFRNRVQHALTLAQRSHQRVAVLFLDLDNFKNVNDSLGHDAGDRLLQAAAQRLVKSTRPSDTVARLGGDEFALVVENLVKPEHAGLVARKLLDAVVPPVTIDSHSVTVTASLGVALYPQDGSHGATLLREADRAMYRAKAEGGNLCRFSSDQIEQRVQRGALVESDLRHALEHSRLVLH